MKKFSVKQYAVALYEATQSCAKQSDVKEVVNNFAAMLARERRLKKAGQVMEEFLIYSKERAGIVGVEITSAKELDKKTIAAIEKIFGKNTESTSCVDSSLIGGIILRTKDHILDASIKTQLKKLRQSLA